MASHIDPAAVAAELRRLPRALGPRLGAALESVLRRHGFDASNLRHPLNQPISLLPRWVAGSSVLCGPVEEALVDDLTVATIVGYLYVRTQDDLVDEGVDDTAAAMLLADALLARHVAIVARCAGGSERFWEFFQSTAWAYGDAMLLERELHRPESVYGEAEFDTILRRSEPIVIPAAVLVDRSDRWSHLPRLMEFTHLVARASQLVDDLRDAARDRDAGNFTWVVRELGGLRSKGEMLTAIVLGGFDAILARADRDLVAAEAIAGELDLAEAGRWLMDRREAMQEMRQSFYDSIGFGSPSARK